MDLWLRKLGLTYKKTLHATEQNHPDVAEKRAHWHEQLAGEGPTQFVFVDESRANTQMTRWRGRAPSDQRLVAGVSHGHYQTSPLISAVRLNGPCAPWLFEGAMDGEMFLAWVAKGWCPHCKKNDLVIMCNWVGGS